jgi:hypothetical protein
MIFFYFSKCVLVVSKNGGKKIENANLLTLSLPQIEGCGHYVQYECATTAN